jgi:hypothetical protein
LPVNPAAVRSIVETTSPDPDAGSVRWLVRRRPVLAALWLILLAGACLLTVRIGFFMFNPARTERSLLPGSAFFTHHWCASAYFEAERLASAGERNIYDLEHYYPGGKPKQVGPLQMDDFVYPPTFLLLPRLGRALSPDPLRLRGPWFVIEALLLAVAFLVGARFVGGAAATLLFPLFWLSLSVLLGLQMGNFHAAMIALSMLAMVAFARGHDVAGGAALAVATAAKLSPAVLVVYLAAQRRWRAVAWTAAFGLAFTVITLAVFGAQPFRTFFGYELARLSSGDAFSFIFSPQAIAARPGPIIGNMSLYGLVFKLHLLGVPGMTQIVARAFSGLCTLGLLAAAIFLGHRHRAGTPRLSPSAQLATWLALATLAAFQGPFVPGAYAALSVAWLLAVLAARPVQTTQHIGLAAIWIALWLHPTLFPPGPTLKLWGFVPQALAIGLCVAVLVRSRRGSPRAAPSLP